MTTPKKKKPKKSRAPPKSLETFADERVEAVHRENAEFARSNRALRSELAKQQNVIAELQQRIAKYEHPGVYAVEQLLAKHPTLAQEDIAEKLTLPLGDVDVILRDMSARGYNVLDGVLSRRGGAPAVQVEHFFGPEARFGIVSDTHIGNNHALEEQLHEAYEVFRREGITTVYAPGNLLDGEKTYRGQEYEIKVMGADNVVAFLADVWPKVEGITTYHIASSTCHEGYYLKNAGILIGKLIENARPDMVYLGLDEADIVLHEGEARPVLRIIHPGGGSSYAQSYRPQKIVESYSGAEKPTMLVIGHYHKSGFYDLRNVATFQAGCLERQTPFMRKRAIEAHMGFWIMELRFTEDGSLRRIASEWFKYYLGMGGKVLRTWST
jgi:hypothetical protein